MVSFGPDNAVGGLIATVGGTRDTDATGDYRGTSGGGDDLRPAAVEFVGGSGAATDVELYALLRRQLLVAGVICVALVVCASLALAYRLAAAAARDQGPPLTPAVFLARNLGNVVALAVFVLMTAALWRVPPATVRGLRAAELLFFGLLAAGVGGGLFDPGWLAALERAEGHPAPARPDEHLAPAYVYAANSTLVLLLYAVLVPNTWRRCAAVTGLMGAAPVLAFAGYAGWARPVPPAVLAEVLMPLGLYAAAAVAAVAFASARIDRYRRLAREARRFGQYVLGDRLGAGGMGEVYRAEHVLLRRPCAVKLVRAERAGDPEALRRFEREARATAALTHPNTVQVFDYGRAADGTLTRSNE